jgi:hypothetical protein
LRSLLNDKKVRRGIYRSVNVLRAVIGFHNADPTPFRWAKSAGDILVSIKRFCR